MRAHPLITTLAAIGAALIVIDGDTIRSDEERIRLEGIDAAEIGHAKSRPSVAWRSSPSTGWNSYARPWPGRREDWCQSLDRRDHAEAALSCAVAY